MLDMSWGEVMVIGGVALIVIGPKDLPKALRTVGQITGKVRRMAGEFHTQFNEAMREAELDDVRKDLETINRNVMSATPAGFNPIQTIRDELKGAVEGKSVTQPPSAPPVAWNSEPVVPMPDLPYDGSAPSSAGETRPETAAVAVVEEGGSPPTMTPTPPTEPHPAAPARPTIDLTGPGLEQIEMPPPRPPHHPAPPAQGEPA